MRHAGIDSILNKFAFLSKEYELRVANHEEHTLQNVLEEQGVRITSDRVITYTLQTQYFDEISRLANSGKVSEEKLFRLDVALGNWIAFLQEEKRVRKCQITLPLNLGIELFIFRLLQALEDILGKIPQNEYEFFFGRLQTTFKKKKEGLNTLFSVKGFSITDVMQYLKAEFAGDRFLPQIEEGMQNSFSPLEFLESMKNEIKFREEQFTERTINFVDMKCYLEETAKKYLTASNSYRFYSQHLYLYQTVTPELLFDSLEIFSKSEAYLYPEVPRYLPIEVLKAQLGNVVNKKGLNKVNLDEINDLFIRIDEMQQNSKNYTQSRTKLLIERERTRENEYTEEEGKSEDSREIELEINNSGSVTLVEDPTSSLDVEKYLPPGLKKMGASGKTTSKESTMGAEFPTEVFRMPGEVVLCMSIESPDPTPPIEISSKKLGEEIYKFGTSEDCNYVFREDESISPEQGRFNFVPADLQFYLTCTSPKGGKATLFRIPPGMILKLRNNDYLTVGEQNGFTIQNLVEGESGHIMQGGAADGVHYFDPRWNKEGENTQTGTQEERIPSMHILGATPGVAGWGYQLTNVNEEYSFGRGMGGDFHRQINLGNVVSNIHFRIRYVQGFGWGIMDGSSQKQSANGTYFAVNSLTNCNEGKFSSPFLLIDDMKFFLGNTTIKVYIYIYIF